MSTPFFLVVEGGPATGRRIAVDAAGVTVGRQADNGLVIDDGQLSRRHAQFALGAGGLVVTDLGSANGTLVNGERIAGARPLRAGDTVRIGATTLRVEGGAAIVPPAPPAPAPPVHGQPGAPAPPPPLTRRTGPVPFVLAAIAGLFLLLCVCGGGAFAFALSRGGSEGGGESEAPPGLDLGPAPSPSGGFGGALAGVPSAPAAGGVPAGQVAPSGAGMPRGNYQCSTRGGSSILDQGWIHIVADDRYQWSENGTVQGGSTQYSYRYDPATGALTFLDGPLSDGREKRYDPASGSIQIGFASSCERRS